MRGAIRCHDAISIVDPRAVITQRLSEQISQYARPLRPELFRGRRCPTVWCWGKVHIEVRLPLSNQANLHAY